MMITWSVSFVTKNSQFKINDHTLHHTNMATERLDIFRVLKAADTKDTTFYSKLEDEEKKQLQPFLVMRWLTGTFSKQQVFLINEVLNPYAFSLYQHKELLWKLSTICTSGKSQRYVWNKIETKTVEHPISVKIIQEFTGYNSRDAVQALKLFEPIDVVEMAEEMGWQDDEINKSRKELGLQTVRISKGKKRTIKPTDLDNFEL